MLRQGFDAWAERAYAGLQISLRNLRDAQPGMAVPLLRSAKSLARHQVHHETQRCEDGYEICGRAAAGLSRVILREKAIRGSSGHEEEDFLVQGEAEKQR